MSLEYKPWLSDDPTEAIEKTFPGGQDASNRGRVYERLHRDGVPLEELLKELVRGVDTLAEVVDSNAVDQIQLVNNIKMMEAKFEREMLNFEFQTNNALKSLYVTVQALAVVYSLLFIGWFFAIKYGVFP